MLVQVSLAVVILAISWEYLMRKLSSSYKISFLLEIIAEKLIRMFMNIGKYFCDAMYEVYKFVKYIMIHMWEVMRDFIVDIVYVIYDIVKPIIKIIVSPIKIFEGYIAELSKYVGIEWYIFYTTYVVLSLIVFLFRNKHRYCMNYVYSFVGIVTAVELFIPVYPTLFVIANSILCGCLYGYLGMRFYMERRHHV